MAAHPSPTADPAAESWANHTPRPHDDLRFARTRFRTRGAADLWRSLPADSREGSRPSRAWLDADAGAEAAVAEPFKGRALRAVPSQPPLTAASAPSPSSVVPLRGDGVRLLVKVEGHRLSIRQATAALGWTAGTRLHLTRRATSCWEVSPASHIQTRRALTAEVMDERGRLAVSDEAGRQMGLATWGQAFVVVTEERLLLVPVAELLAA